MSGMRCQVPDCRHLATVEVDGMWCCEVPTKMRLKNGQVMSVLGGCAEVIRSRRPVQPHKNIELGT